jgi:cytochrome P450
MATTTTPPPVEITVPRSIAELPAPRGLPLLGNAHQLARTSRLHLTAEKWARRFGPIVRLDIGRRRIVAISDAEEIHRILRERPQGFRRWRDQETVIMEMGSPESSPGVFIAEGEAWKRQRRLVVTALNTNHLHRYFDVIRIATERLHRRLGEAAADGRALEIGREMTSYTVDVISTLAFGHDLNTLEKGENELQLHIARVLEMTARRLAMPVPYWRWFKLPADRALARSLAELRKAQEEFIAQARARMTARPELYEAPENMLEAMLAAQRVDGTFTDEEIITNVGTIITAGEDTTAHTLSWTIWLLASRPEIQRRLAAEADEVVGGDSGELFPLDHGTIANLPYGEAVIRESMRLKTVAPLLTLEPLEDTTICEAQIPAGTRLLLLLRQAGYEREPAGEFDPERWLCKSQARASESLVFGAGPRFCPGRNLAFLEAKTALGMIARNFEFELDTSKGPVQERFGFTMIPKGLRVRLRERAADRLAVVS